MKKTKVFRKIVYYLLGVLEVLFTFRLIFKILGANPTSNFVSQIYKVSGIFLSPFRGIFGVTVNNGIETKSVLEPATIIAMIVYALIAYGIVTLIRILKTHRAIPQELDEKVIDSKSYATKVETTTSTLPQSEENKDSSSKQNIDKRNL
jgi:hypothetical protein